MALRPYEGELETSTTFLGTQYTVARLSPVLFENVRQTTVFSAMMKELQDTPGDHLKVWGPRFAEETFLEGRPWDRGMPLNSWAVWAEAPEERAAGLRFAPRIRSESHKKRFWIEVWGVGLWPETGDLVLVATYGYGTLSEHSRPHLWWGPDGGVAVLCHDPRLDMFRFMNLEDYGIDLDTMRYVTRGPDGTLQYMPRGVSCRKKTAD
jgi:hypothetical protein